MGFNKGMTAEEKKQQEEFNLLIYQKQYDRKVSIYHAIAAKPTVYFLIVMAYIIYNGTSMPVATYAVLIAGVILIYRNLINEKFYETDKLFLIKKVIDIFLFLSKKGREKNRRFVDKAKALKVLDKLEKKQKRLERIAQKKAEEQKKLDDTFEE